MRKVIGCAVVQDKKLVLVRKEKEGRSSWILPGGKPEEGEVDLETLTREFREELPFVKLPEQLRYYGLFNGVSPNKGDVIENKVYVYETNKPLDLTMFDDDNEPIKEARLLAYEWIIDLNLSDTTRKVVKSLRKDYYL